MNIANKVRILLFTSAFGLVANMAVAAEKISLGIHNSFSGIRATTSIESLDRNYQFKPSKKFELANGKVKYKLEQFYKGIPVWDSAVVSNTEEVKDLESLSGNYVANIEDNLDTTDAQVTEEQAKQSAIKAASIEDTQKIQNFNAKIYIKNYSDVAKLVYVVDFFYANNEFSRRPFAMIDANSGEVLEKWEGLDYTYAQATGPGGNAKTGKYTYGVDYPGLLVKFDNGTCEMDSPNVTTFTLNNQKINDNGDTGGSIFKFTCPESAGQEVNGAYAPSNDAHFFGNVVFDLYNTWYNKAPWDKKITLKVNSGVGFENAFYNGKEVLIGDGSSKVYPLTSLDIISHEISHGFTAQTSKLRSTGEAGAINESFSDIAGEAAEYFMNQNKPQAQKTDWMVGESIVKEKGKAVRYFANPTKDGASIDNTNKFRASMNNHYSSGIYNKAFYLLANKPNWDIKKAFDIFVLANQTYWTQETNFNQGACNLKEAAEVYEYETDDVIDAFKAVGVDATCTNRANTPDAPIDQTPAPVKDNTPKATVTEQTQFGLATVVADSSMSNFAGKAGEAKLFIIDVTKKNMSALKTRYIFGNADSKVTIAFEKEPTADNNECIIAAGNVCQVSNPKVGRYFIRVNSDRDYLAMNLWVGLIK